MLQEQKICASRRSRSRRYVQAAGVGNMCKAQEQEQETFASCRSRSRRHVQAAGAGAGDMCKPQEPPWDL